MQKGSTTAYVMKLVFPVYLYQQFPKQGVLIPYSVSESVLGCRKELCFVPFINKMNVQKSSLSLFLIHFYFLFCLWFIMDNWMTYTVVGVYNL